MAGTWKRIGSDQSVTGNLKDALTVDVPEPSGDTFTSLMVVLETTGTSGSADCPIFFGTSSAIDHGQNYRYSFNPNNSGLDGDGSGGSKGANVVTRGGSNHCFSVTYINGNQTGKEKFAHGYEVDDNAQTGTGSGAIPRRSHYAFKWTNTSSYIRKISVDTRESGSASSITFNDKSKMIVYGSTDEETTDEKDSLTNVPANTRYEETDTRKIYRSKSVGFPSGTSGSGSDWTEVVFDSSTATNGASASGNVVTRTGTAAWNAYIRSTTHYLDPSEGGGEVYFTVSNNTHGSVGLEKTPFNSHPTGTYQNADYSFHTTIATNNIYESTTSYDGTDWNNATNEWRITMDSAGEVKYYYRENSSGSWNLERTSTVTASGKYYVTASPNGTASCTCYIKSDATIVWKERGTA